LNLRRIRLVPSPAFFGSVRGLRRGGKRRRASGRRPSSSRQNAQEITPTDVWIEPIVHVLHQKALTISASFGLFRSFTFDFLPQRAPACSGKAASPRLQR
jgi:hypothetical protein